MLEFERTLEVPSRSLLNINFSLEDQRPHNYNTSDPLLITACICQKKIHCVYINNGICTDILYEHCLQQLLTSRKEDLKPLTGGPLVGFTRHNLLLLLTIHFLLMLVSHDGREKITRTIEFSVIHFPIEQNILLGRLTLFQLQVIPSTIHGIVKFSTRTGPITIIASSPHLHASRQNIATPELV